MTGIEIVAVVAGVLCVWLTVRQNIWCWPVGLIQVGLYIFIFYEVKLYSDMLLHAIYVVLGVYGWFHWARGGTDRKKLPVTRLNRTAIPVWLAMTLIASASWGFFMSRYTDAALPYGDAFTTVASLVAQWLMVRKRLESWIVWITVDVVAIGIYAYKDLWLTSLLYLMFLGLAIAGFIAWRWSFREESNSRG